MAELEAQAAQTIALNHEEVVAFSQFVDAQGDQAIPLRTQVFGVWPVLPSDITPQTEVCRTQGRCYRVELYSFAHNGTLLVWVDLETQTVIHTAHLPNASPDLPPALADRAIEIALASRELTAELGFTPDADQATMANVKSALNNTTCERSRHLCVAPTFIVGETALWAIVDLTDERLVGMRWTDVGGAGPTILTQQTLEFETVFEDFCQQTNHLEQDGWSMDYVLTSSDGLLLTNVRFHDTPVLESVKLVDWHVSYSGDDGFGYSDAVGCPIFSQAAVGAYAGPSIEPIVAMKGGSDGFALLQDYAHANWPMPCNYRYQQRFDFYRDGSFRVTASNLGRGCGNHGTYRPVFRIHLAAPTGGFTFEEWNGASWQVWEEEGWQLHEGETSDSAEGFQYRIVDGQGRGYGIIPGDEQSQEGRLDNAYVYVTRYVQGEGDMDLVTIGACCNTDFHQGPERYISTPPERIQNEEIVLWYVAQMENSNYPGREYCWADLVVEEGIFVPRTWPCTAGPLFIPIEVVPVEGGVP